MTYKKGQKILCSNKHLVGIFKKDLKGGMKLDEAIKFVNKTSKNTADCKEGCGAPWYITIIATGGIIFPHIENNKQ